MEALYFTGTSRGPKVAGKEKAFAESAFAIAEAKGNFVESNCLP